MCVCVSTCFKFPKKKSLIYHPIYEGRIINQTNRKKNIEQTTRRIVNKKKNTMATKTEKKLILISLFFKFYSPVFSSVFFSLSHFLWIDYREYGIKRQNPGHYIYIFYMFDNIQKKKLMTYA